MRSSQSPMAGLSRHWEVGGPECLGRYFSQIFSAKFWFPGYGVPERRPLTILQHSDQTVTVILNKFYYFQCKKFKIDVGNENFQLKCLSSWARRKENNTRNVFPVVGVARNLCPAHLLLLGHFHTNGCDELP